MAKTKTDKLTVRLRVAHTHLGRPGDVCEMPAAKARAHAELGLLDIVDDAAPPPDPPKPRKPPPAVDASDR